MPIVQNRRNLFVYGIALAAALSGFLFGFDTAIINGALIFLRQELHLTNVGTEIAAGSLLMGCVVGSGAAGALADRHGRRPVLLVAAALFGFSSLATALPRNLLEFAIARMIAGIAIGSASVLAPMYIAEVSPARIRGILVSLNQLAIATGILAAFCVSWLLSRWGESSWRWMFAVAAIPSFAFLVAMLFVPESPRWLLRAGYRERALCVLEQISDGDVAKEVSQMEQSLAEETGGLSELFTPGLRRPLMIAITLACLSQISGINTVNYYGAILFRDHAGTNSPTAALGINMIIGTAGLIATIGALFIIDRVGRRPLLIAGAAGMTISLCVLGIALRTSPPPTNAILAAVLIYVGFFDLSFGPVTWVCLAELFPTAVRGRAMSLATLTLWSACLIVSLTFLTLIQILTAGGTFFFYACICGAAFAFVWRYVPETKGRSLEEIHKMWVRRK